MSLNTILLYIAIGVALGGVLIFFRKRYGGPVSNQPSRPFPYQWRAILEEHVGYYQRLSRPEKEEFERRVHIFLLNVNIVGIETEVTHRDRVLVAAGGVIPIFKLTKWHYANLKEVQMHPDKFPIPESTKMAKGLTGWGAMEGKMMLSQKALLEGFQDDNDQINIAIHEFVHILDKQDGKIDGVLSKMLTKEDLKPWLDIVNKKMREINTEHSTIRDYGGTNQAEFLAVVSEFYFESPDKMRSEHPALFNALDSFYNQRGPIGVKWSQKTYW